MKILLFANTDWYLYNFRRSLALDLREAGHETLLMSPPGHYGEKLQSMGFCFIAAPMVRRSLNPLREVSLILWLRRQIKREKPDLVHGFTLKCAIYGLLAARLAGRSARVASVAGLGYVFVSGDLRARMLRPLVRALIKTALGGPNSRLILQNSDDAELFTRFRLVDTDAIRLIRGSGVDCERFTPAANTKIAQSATENIRVVLAARLLWDKGLREFVSAARQLIQKRASVEFLLAGVPDPGNPASADEWQVRAWVDEGVIRWLGHVDDMPGLFQSADIAVLPSYREGLPKGLIEAAACSLAIVTTDVPGCREVVTHEVDGLIVPVRDASALAAAIGRLCEDPDLRQSLGMAAREKAVNQFDERIVNSRTIAVYEELVPDSL